MNRPCHFKPRVNSKILCLITAKVVEYDINILFGIIRFHSMKRTFVPFIIAFLFCELTLPRVAKGIFLCHRSLATLIANADERLAHTETVHPPMIHLDYSDAWFRRLYPRSVLGSMISKLKSGTNNLKFDALIPPDSMAYFHGFVDVARYDKPLTTEDILVIMTSAGHASRWLVTESERRYRTPYLALTSEQRQNILDEVFTEHFTDLTQSKFGAIKEHLKSFDEGDNYSSRYISGSIRKGICVSYCLPRPTEKDASGFLIKLRPNIASILLSKLESRTRHPKRSYFEASSDSVNLYKPMYRFVATNSEVSSEVIDLVYLPSQIEAMIRFDENGVAQQAFHRFSHKPSIIVIKDYSEGMVSVVEYK